MESDENELDCYVSMVSLLDTTQPKLTPEKSKNKDTEDTHVGNVNVNVCSGDKQRFEKDEHLQGEPKFSTEKRKGAELS